MTLSLAWGLAGRFDLIAGTSVGGILAIGLGMAIQASIFGAMRPLEDHPGPDLGSEPIKSVAE